MPRGRLIEVQVIAVRRIVIGRERGAERLACRIACGVQEVGRPVFPWPIAQDRYAPAVGEDEGGDVDGIADCVLAPAAGLTPADPAAIGGAQVLHRDHARAEELGRGRLHAVPQP